MTSRLHQQPCLALLLILFWRSCWFFGHNFHIRRYFSDPKEAPESWFRDGCIGAGIFRFWSSFMSVFCSQSPKSLFWLRHAFLVRPSAVFWKLYLSGKLLSSTFQKYCYFLQIVPYILSIMHVAFLLRDGYLGCFKSKGCFQGMGFFVFSCTRSSCSLFSVLIIVVVILKHFYVSHWDKVPLLLLRVMNLFWE